MAYFTTKLYFFVFQCYYLVCENKGSTGHLHHLDVVQLCGNMNSQDHSKHYFATDKLDVSQKDNDDSEEQGEHQHGDKMPRRVHDSHLCSDRQVCF